MSELPTKCLWADARCEHQEHGVLAATVALLVAADPDLPAEIGPMVFTLSGAEFAYGVRDFDDFVDGIWDEPDPAAAAVLADAVRAGDFDALRVAHREYAPFWCRACARSYCREHWTLAPVFDPPGQFDYYHGTCPSGHPAMIDHM